MAKKPVLDATSRPKSAFGDWTKNYRQSANIIDERAKQFRPTETPDDAAETDLPGGWNGSTRQKTMRPKNETDEMYGASTETSDTTPKTRSDQTRKTSVDEAIRKTHIERR